MLHTLVFHSLQEQIAVIDDAGTIIDVNAAWIGFGVDNGLPADYEWLGANYLHVLAGAHSRDDDQAGHAATGILDVLHDRRASFDMEYPCHSPGEQRWFVMRVTRLATASQPLVAISHYNITARKLAEQRAEYLALHDPLTDMANRRYFNIALKRATRSSVQNRSPVSLIALDVDHFKDYNDACGHPAGDDCLAQVAQAIRKFARRPGDLPARLGGDEFAVLLGGTDAAQSQRLAEAILTSVDNLRIGYGDGQQVTLSAGVASVIAHHHEDSAEHLLRDADDALYRAKQAGRNQVAVHADPCR
ncbi:GGDEF domain-containing protein [Mycolicibacterium sp. 050158]|uniref:GGDEF domain-containing protein n=1 Tax=Mycolicibacterium sp. 050158 TaxID=3090602 RepID=UPI00299F2147|nr:GGDEF domain-containing protein [Mycolicibacterium sp. 050158]MDX1893424.1 GGDEF domain-containing protein [Mycolicibacterium sp. 050158]